MTQRQDPILAITFLYYRDLTTAEAFWRNLGFPMVIDQGFAKIFRVAAGAHVGLVDEAKGMNDWHEQKCVQVCLRVPDVDAWHDWAKTEPMPGVSAMSENEALGIRAFVFNDSEGYQIEVQSTL
ncbi:MAG: VOC family protein [Actinomycetia bacterium]|nr:VOC family protein [Actinomycetes bacterium]